MPREQVYGEFCFFLGNQYNLPLEMLATRYIDDNTLLPGGKLGNNTVWNQRPVFPPPVITYLLNGSSGGVESAYAHEIDVPFVAELLGQPTPNASASGFVLLGKCLYMVALGTGMTMSIIFGNGSEQVLLNTYALFSLMGTVFYSFFIIKEGYHIFRFVRRGLSEMRLRGRLQLLVSVGFMSISNRVWHLNYPFLLVFGFFTVLSWTIGASKAVCMWYIHDTPVRDIPADALDTSVTPEYRCHSGAIGGPLSSTWEFIRFMSAASVVSYIVLGRSTLLGVHRSVSAWAMKEILTGPQKTRTVSLLAPPLKPAEVPKVAQVSSPMTNLISGAQTTDTK